MSAVQQAKALLKKHLRKARRRYIELFQSFDRGQFEKLLLDLGIRAGDTIFVHSSFAAFAGFRGQASDVLAAIAHILGDDGTLLMPSMPFTGTAIQYVQSGAVTNLARTPSQMGLLSELFRRQRGTHRSRHPTHPVLGRGAQAQRLLEGHEKAATPCGERSPYAKLPDVDAKIVLLGTTVETMTYFHCLEEEFETRMPRSPFTKQQYDMTVRDDSDEITMRNRLFEPTLSRHRNISKLTPELIGTGSLKELRLGTLSASVVTAVAARSAFASLIERGVDFYDA